MRNYRFKRAIAMLAVLLMVVSLIPADLFTSVNAYAATSASIAKNQGTRDVVATSLSADALAYYTGEYSYDVLKNQTGETLENTLYTLMSSTQTDHVSYKALTSYWPTTDTELGNSSDATLFYSDVESSSYNREHVWPKSRGSFYQQNCGADLHHLRPTNEQVNSTRGNHTMGTVDKSDAGTKAVTYNGKIVGYVNNGADLFEPLDNVKGDVARIYLYVYTRWQQPNLFEDVTSGLPTMDSDDNANDGKKVIESLDTLLKWCAEDPVDTWEMQRNDAVEDIQGNRNAFIDYPELAWLMFNQEIPADVVTPSMGNGTETPDVPVVTGTEPEVQPVQPVALDKLEGKNVYVYTAKGNGVLGAETTNSKNQKVISVAKADVTGENISAEDGAVCFTAAKNGNFYTFYNSELGYLCAEGTGSNAFYSKEPAENANLWAVAALNDGYTLANQLAKYNGNPQYLEYYTTVTTYSFKEANAEIYTFSFYESESTPVVPVEPIPSATAAPTAEPTAVPTPVVTPAVSAKTFTLVTSVNDITDGKYIFVGQASSKYAAMNNNFGGSMGSTAITVSDGTIETEDKSIIWNIEKVGDKYTIRSEADSAYLSMGNTTKNKNFKTAATSTSENYTQFDPVTFEKDGNKCISFMTTAADGKERIISSYVANGEVVDFRSYQSTNLYVTLLYKLTETAAPTASPEPTATEAPTPTVTEAPIPTVTEAPTPTITEAPTPTVQPSDIVSISTVISGSVDDTFKVKGIVTLDEGQNLYIMDATGGLCVRGTSKDAVDAFTVGDIVIAEGKKSVYNGLVQLGSANVTKCDETGVLTAQKKTIGELTAADVASYVEIEDLEVTEVYDNNGKFSTPNITVTDGTNKIQIYKAVVNKVDGAWEYKVGDHINFKGAVGIYQKDNAGDITLQLRNSFTSEIEKVVVTPDPEDLVSISTALSGANGDIFKVKGAVTLVDGKNIYIQDGTGAIDAYFSTVPSDIALGDTIIVSGKRANYNDLPELSGATAEKTNNKIKLTAAVKNISELSNADICSYVEIKQVKVTEIYDNNGQYSNPNITVEAGGKSVQLYKAVVNKVNGAYEFAVGDYVTIKAAVGTFTDSKTKVSKLQLRNTLASEVTKVDAPVQSDLILEEGKQYVIYNFGSQGVLAQEGDTLTVNNALATIENGAATEIANGGVVFTVSKNGDYYRFYNETYGFLCSNGTGSNAFYKLPTASDYVAEEADWSIRTTSPVAGAFHMVSRVAKYNGKYEQWLEFFAGSFKTYSYYNVSDETIYAFAFYPTTEELTNGIVNKPGVVEELRANAYVGSDYTTDISLQSVFGLSSFGFTVNGQSVEAVPQENGSYRVIVPAALIKAPTLTITVSGADMVGKTFVNNIDITVIDEPTFSGLYPAQNANTGDNKKPSILAKIGNAGENAVVTMTVNGETVNAVYANGVVSYMPSAEFADGKVTVTVTVVRADGVTAKKSWSFIVGESKESLYFGQLHAHTAQYSDGAGTLAEGLNYIKNLPESANVDFVAFTDHSNYFDTTGAANPENALYDTSLMTAASLEKWNNYVNDQREFNNSQSSVVALPGFEMTWSGGPGHINTWNTPGVVSRNNSTLNSKTNNAGIQSYYKLLSDEKGAGSLSQLNHPGSTFGTFVDFSFWDAVIDSRVFLVEVGNGEGQVGEGGYFPSYEYYTMALDKGWHVAPTNNQDNHKGKWGNANDARDVILTDDFSEQGIYEAIRNLKVYATEDKNLEIGYTLNGQALGSSITEVPEKLNIEVSVYDPDATDSISKVEVVVNSGKVAYTWDSAAELATGSLSCELDPTYSYYFIRVTEGDGDIAVTAPVWVGETLMLGISSVVCGTSTPVTNEELTLTTTLFNSEKTEATIKSIVYTVDGSKVVGTDTEAQTIPAGSTKEITFNYTPDKAKVTNLTANVTLVLDGVEYEFSMGVELDVLNADELVYIGIDAAHYNEYVAGNYKDSMGNFGLLAAGYSVRTNELKSSEALIEACSNDKYKALILTAPSRRLADAQANPGVYSDAELAAIKAFAAKGGTIILAGWSDYYENYDAVADKMTHMSTEQNRVLEALGSSLRINDDATNDDSYNGGQTQRLYFASYNMDSYLLEGVDVDPDHVHNYGGTDKMYTEFYSQYGGCSIYVIDENGNAVNTIPANVTPVVFGHETTYTKDSDGDGLATVNGTTPKYAYGDEERIMVLATEEIDFNGTKATIIVAGAAFMSNFEVQATINDNGAEKNYSNYKLCENLVKSVNPVKVTDIAEVQAQTEAGIKYTIEGIVTSNASGFDKETAFFDCIYVQDATAGICCFPVAGNYKIGDKVRITGTTDWYQGEAELQVTKIEVIGTGSVTAVSATAAELNAQKLLGSLVTVSGKVTDIIYANGIVESIMVKDATGETRIFIDGYITSTKAIENLEIGGNVTATGLSSYDDTYAGIAPRIRVRDRADVVCEKAEAVVTPEPEVTPEPIIIVVPTVTPEPEEEIVDIDVPEIPQGDDEQPVKTFTKVTAGSKAYLTGKKVNQFVSEVGQNVTIVMTVNDAEGNTRYSVAVDSADMVSGAALYAFILTEDGEYIMVNSKKYTVNENGSVLVNFKKNAAYVLVNEEDAKAIREGIHAASKARWSKRNVEAGKNVRFWFDKSMNMENIASIEYSMKAGNGKINKNGLIKGLKAGKATAYAKLTFVDGSEKTVKLTINVK